MKTPFLLLACAGPALAYLTSTLSAQAVGGAEDVALRFDGTTVLGFLGTSVAGVGDLDGDGFGDVVVGAPDDTFNGRKFAGEALVFSGSTGAELFLFGGLTPVGLFGTSVAGPGDVDGDGIPDLLVGAPQDSPGGLTSAGSAFVFSGATGTQLFRFDGKEDQAHLGHSVAGAGDVDGDGHADLIVGIPFFHPNGLESAGSALVFSGATGKPLLAFDGVMSQEKLGVSVAGAGDVDGDGIPDLIVGALGTRSNGKAFGGTAFVFSGATGSQIRRFDGKAPRDFFGRAVAGAGDVNGDGLADLIVGAPGTKVHGFADSGSALVFSGATGARIFRFDGSEEFAGLGFSVAGAGDVDGDGHDDLLVGARGASPQGLKNAGSVFIFSGATGAQLFRMNGLEAMDTLGSAVAEAGDVDGDGRPDLIAGAALAGPAGYTGAGSAFVYTFNPILTASARSLSISAGGAVDYTLDFPDGDAGREYGILLSAHGTGPTLFRGLLVPLAEDRFFLASTQGIPLPQTKRFQGRLDSEGRAHARFTAAPGSLPARLIGHKIFLAAVNKNLDSASVARALSFRP